MGGPTLVRAAAKSCDAVTVVVDPSDYDDIGAALAADGTTAEQRRALALKAFLHTSRYDAAISTWLTQQLTPEPPSDAAPERLTLELRRSQVLRYGENPHQQAALYHATGEPELGGVYGPMTLLWGKALSYNNVLDLDAAVGLVAEFDAPAASVIKHTNPAGCAVVEGADHAEDAILAAYLLARSGDPISAFGGIVALNAPVHAALATALTATFLEVVAAPAFTEDALAILKRKKNLRLVEAPGLALDAPPPATGLRARALGVGTLVQSADASLRAAGGPELEIVTERAPDDAEIRSMRFLWRVCKHVRSNAIVIGGPDTPTADWPVEGRGAPDGLRTYGVGAGQMSRVDAVRLAVDKATHPLQGATLASDAFFPFADGLEIAAEAGVTTAIQPGGSRRDAEVIAAADAAHVAMALTGQRHFRH
ncbi:MAG: bifunctional phosphoribosylaminoimidazolecarboxamide formyltransferase/IMP cyclohydrolase PurH [Myxococcales bacterium]|nr:bifunctional phosphoribosylaminoimidazolecarboxamide formyltransferase/IMP cyclohydrolase PurH [Myxococcales bacterium]